MEIPFAVLVHADALESPHPPNMIPGVIRAVGFESFPASMQKIYVLLGVVGAPEDYGNHTIHVHYQDADGNQIGDALDKAFVLRPDLPKLRISIPYVQLSIPEPGSYSFEVRIDGQPVRSLPLRATLGPPSSHAQRVPAADGPPTVLHVAADAAPDVKGDGPWLVTLSLDANIAAAGPFVLTLIPPRSEREIGLLVNAELEDYKGHDIPAPGVEVREHLVMRGGLDSAHIPSLKLGDANKQRVVAGKSPFDITLMSAKTFPPKPGNAFNEFTCEVLVARAE